MAAYLNTDVANRKSAAKLIPNYHSLGLFLALAKAKTKSNQLHPLF